MKIKVEEYMDVAKKICKDNRFKFDLLRDMCRSYNDESMIFLKDTDTKEIPDEDMLKNKTKMVQVMEIFNTNKGFKYKIYNDKYIK